MKSVYKKGLGAYKTLLGKKINVQIARLSAFNKRFYKKVLGLQISKKRQELGRSCEEIADLLGITGREIRQIESGHRNISQEQFEFFVTYFSLNTNELVHMSKITHVQYLMDIYREIDENYPA